MDPYRAVRPFCAYCDNEDAHYLMQIRDGRRVTGVPACMGCMWMLFPRCNAYERIYEWSPMAVAEVKARQMLEDYDRGEG